MVFTFLNVVVVNGILIGLVEGSSGPNRDHYSGDVLISSPEDKLFIKNSDNIVSSLERTEGVLAVSPRYIVPARVQTDYTKKIKASELPDQVSSLVVGIDPEKEELVTNLSSLLSEGSYLDEDDFSQILIDGSLLSQYSRGVPGEEL